MLTFHTNFFLGERKKYFHTAPNINLTSTQSVTVKIGNQLGGFTWFFHIKSNYSVIVQGKLNHVVILNMYWIFIFLQQIV